MTITEKEITEGAADLISKGVDREKVKEFMRIGLAEIASSQAPKETMIPRSQAGSVIRKVVQDRMSPSGIIPPVSKFAINPEEAVQDVKSFAKGALSGATLGALGKEPMSGSVMDKSPTARKIGQFAGAIAPIVGAEATGGALLGRAALSRGAGQFGQAIAKGFGTGMTYEGMRGGVEGKPLAETASDMVSGGLLFGGLSFGGQALGYMRELFGESLADKLATHFVNTPIAVAKKLYDKGSKNLGRQTLEKAPEILDFNSQDQAFKIAGREAAILHGKVNTKIDQMNKALEKPTTPTSRIEGTPQLEYKPGTVDRPGATLPRESGGSAYSTGREGDPEMVRLGDIVKTQQPGGSTYQSLSAGRGVPLDYTGQTPIGAELGGASSRVEKELFLRQRAIEAEKLATPSLNREGTATIKEIADSLDPLIKEYDTAATENIARRIQKVKERLYRKHNQILTPQDLVDIKRQYDKIVGKNWLKTSGDKMAVNAEIAANIADTARKKLYQLNPELGELSGRESLMIYIRDGLKNAGAERTSGGQALEHGMANTALNLMFRSRGAGGLSKTLNEYLGTPSKVVAPIARQVVRKKATEKSPTSTLNENIENLKNKVEK